MNNEKFEDDVFAVRVPYGDLILSMVWCTFGTKHPRFVVVPELFKFRESERDYVKSILDAMDDRRWSSVFRSWLSRRKYSIDLSKKEMNIDVLRVKLGDSKYFFVREEREIVDGPFGDERMAHYRAGEQIEHLLADGVEKRP